MAARIENDQERHLRYINEQLSRCLDLLAHKGDEYSSEADIFHNFNVAAELFGTNPVQALGGMMSKHTVSIYDMIAETAPTGISQDDIDIDKWDEKITDHINYLLLLSSMIHTMKNKDDY